MLSDIEIEILLNSFAEFYQPKPSEREILKQVLNVVHFCKGELLLEMESHSTKIWFLYKGFVREVTQEALTGNTFTSWFWFSGDFIFSRPFFLSKQVSITQIEAISECQLLELSYFDLFRLRKLSSDIDLLIEQLRAQCEMERLNFYAAFHGLSSKERFEKYYNLHRPLFNVAKHKDIASFLGIKDDGFNRFKK